MKRCTGCDRELYESHFKEGFSVCNTCIINKRNNLPGFLESKHKWLDKQINKVWRR